MFDCIAQLFSKGDVAQLEQKFLFSGAWNQGQHKCYGKHHQRQLWLDWLRYFGVAQIRVLHQIERTGFTAVLAELNLEQADSKLPVSFLIEHNQRHIKSVEFEVHTQHHTQYLENMTQCWPEPDPLMLSDYDQQHHLEHIHLRPSQLLALSNSLTSCLDNWWQIWQSDQIYNVTQVYAENATLHSVRQSFTDITSIRRFILQVKTQLSRSYAQIIDIYDDKKSSTVVVKWHLEGDCKCQDGTTLRVRLPFTSWLQLTPDLKDPLPQIKNEYLFIDTISLKKRFTDPKVAEIIQFL